MASNNKEVANDLFPLIRVYKDGTVERLFGSPYVPPTPEDSTTGVSSKDITISPTISARLYLPKLIDSEANKKLPILVYFHGGGFCVESAFSSMDQNYLNSIVSETKAVAVSVEYRLAPEHLLPEAYEDCWDALQWVASQSLESAAAEPWLTNHGDFNRVYIGGDSAGGNIVHNIALRAGKERESLTGDVKIFGGFLSQPYFCGSKLIGSEANTNYEQSLPYRLWDLVYPSAPGGIDNPLINPFADDAPSLAGLACSRLLVIVSEKDELRDRGIKYYEAVKESGWKGEVELTDVEGENHCFHVLNPESEKAKHLIRRLASFIK